MQLLNGLEGDVNAGEKVIVMVLDAVLLYGDIGMFISTTLMLMAMTSCRIVKHCVLSAID